MTVEPSGVGPKLGTNNGVDSSLADEWSRNWRFGWYFTKEEIEKYSPSRKDGIDSRTESQLRMLYCSFIRDVSIRLELPQIVIATAIMFCHRFYLHQSHAKNDWQTIATVCLFLASKVEDKPCGLDKVIIAAYETIHKKDAATARKIHQKEVFTKQKALVLIGERLLLTTIRFDFNVQHPYKPLLDALKKLGITQKDVRQVAWNYINDWLWTTLCMQYKPHYIAAGSLFLAAKRHDLHLPVQKGCVWWHEFDVTPQQLEAVIRQMTQIMGYNRRSLVATSVEKLVQASSSANKEASSSPDSVLNRPDFSTNSSSHDSNVDVKNQKPKDLVDHDIASASKADEQLCVDSAVEVDCETLNSKNSVSCAGEISRSDVSQTTSKNPDSVCPINIDKIRAMVKKRKRDREGNNCPLTYIASSEDLWIERELEMGIELEGKPVAKRQSAS